jgi:hypothetical protein
MLRSAAMRVLLALVIFGACDKGNSAVEEARRQEEEALKEKQANGTLPKAIKPPVSGTSKLPCSQVIDIEKYASAFGEKESMTVKDVSKAEPDAVSSCDLVRGGKKLTDADQQALLKKEGKLGMLAGDTMCNVTLFCSTIEDPDRFKKKCEEQAAADLKKSQSPFAGMRADDTMGNFACVQVVPTGAFDAMVYKFFDADTKCIFKVRGGPSTQDNDMVRKCAQTARDTIGVQQIAVSGK